VPRAVRERLILDVAGQIFARRGYHAAAMDEIAASADVSKPMLYAYFGSKEGLYLAYVDRTGRELLDRLAAAGAAGSSPMSRLRARIGEFLAFVEEHRDGWSVLFAEMASSRPLADEVATLRSQIADAVRRMITAEDTATHLSDTAADAVAHAIVGAGESLANWWLAHPAVDRDRVAAWYVGMVHADVTNAEPPV
jgi:AcrR family transcriptional regulator